VFFLLSVYPIKTEVIKPNTDLAKTIADSLYAANLTPRDGDVIAISAKVVSFSEGNLIRLEGIRPSSLAYSLANKYSLPPEFVEAILAEADEVLGGVSGALLTIKNNIIVANAGLDLSNAPPGYAIPWPKDPKSSCEKLRKKLRELLKADICTMITDSKVHPLRLGSTSIALAVSGFQPVEDLRGSQDLFGKTIKIKRMALADALACAAQLVMGEARESCPAALIRGISLKRVNSSFSTEMTISKDECLYLKNLKPSFD